MKVKLYKKAIQKGAMQSLYLQVTGAGKRTREYLELHIHTKPKTPLEKSHNESTMAMAQSLASKRQLVLQSQMHGLVSKELQQIDFVEYFEQWRGEYEKLFADYRKVDACLMHFREFLLNKKVKQLPMAAVTKVLSEDFAEYLKTKVKGESASTYFKKFKKILNRAYDEQMLSFHPLTIKAKFVFDKNAITKPLASEAEIQKLIETPCSGDEVRRAYLFCYNMGFDFATVKKTLTWKCIDGRWINFERSKSKTVRRFYMNDNATSYIPQEKGLDNELVFKLKTYANCMKIVRKWCEAAGIKRLTWHSVRHSLATNLHNDHGVDLATLQEVMGHADIKNTRKYTHVNQKKVQEAMEKLNLKKPD